MMADQSVILQIDNTYRELFRTDVIMPLKIPWIHESSPVVHAIANQFLQIETFSLEPLSKCSSKQNL